MSLPPAFFPPLTPYSLRRSAKAFIALSGVALLLIPAGVASAQDAPWSVTMTMTNPIPIGNCGAVRLDVIDPKTRDVPRRPTGDRVSIADFDMTVTGGGVAPQWLDAYHLRACGCQTGTVGGSALVTASYPAKALPEGARVPGVSVKATKDFSLGKPDNDREPAACVTPSVAPVVAIPGLPTAPAATSTTTRTSTPVALAPAPVPLPARTPVLPAAAPPAPPLTPITTPLITAAPVSTAPVTTAPASTAPATTAPLPTSMPGTPIAGAPLPGALRLTTGVVPTGLKLLPNVPIIASLVWDSMPNAVTYSLRRAVGTGAFVERASLGQSSEKGARDVIPDPRDTYLYTITVTYADGTFGTSPSVQFISPPLRNPAGFTAKDKGDGNVEFAWQPVPGAVSYRLDGPGFPSTGLSVADSTSVNQPEIPGGANSWKLTTLYAENHADYANPSIASAVVRVLPPHPPWLSKNNGPGSFAQVQMPREGAYFCTFILYTGCLHETVTPNQLQSANDFGTDWLGAREAPVFEATSRFGLFAWLDMDPVIKLWDNPLQFPNEAVYGNPGDLGVGRRSACFQRTRTSMLPGVYTVCYAAAHGIAPGRPGFNDPAVINRPGEGEDPQFLLSMVITKEPTGTVFMVFGPGETKYDEFYGIPFNKYRLSTQVTLDTEGSKFVPHACLSCHGGKYNETTRKVDGASFLPIDPGLQSFATEADKASQQEKIRVINSMIVASAPTSAVAAYIRGLYGNAVSVPGTLAKVDYVPQGWTEESGFYRSVVKPYCAMCHLAAPESWNFASLSNFKENAALIEASVCKTHSMPHSELQFKAFWTKDTGPVYTPGLLATLLKFPLCR